MSLSIPFLFWWLLNKKAARVEVNLSLAFLHWVGIALHPRHFVFDIAIFVLKEVVKLQLRVIMLIRVPVCVADSRSASIRLILADLTMTSVLTSGASACPWYQPLYSL